MKTDRPCVSEDHQRRCHVRVSVHELNKEPKHHICKIINNTLLVWPSVDTNNQSQKTLSLQPPPLLFTQPKTENRFLAIAAQV